MNFKIRIGFLFALSLGLASTPSLAETLDQCFEKSYFDLTIYKQNWCNRNVRNLYGACFAHEPSNHKAHVIYLLSVNSDEQMKKDVPTIRVYPFSARSGTRVWNFHVILERDGLIYDLDYTTQPQITDVFTYFEKMFRVPGVNVKYVARIIDADEYLANYETNGKDADYYIYNHDHFYPLQDVLNYLKTFPRGAPAALQMMALQDHLL